MENRAWTNSLAAAGLAVVLCGCNVGGLEENVGPSNVNPVAAVSANANEGDAPLTVTFDATGSADSDGTIARYDWDFDNDGTVDISTTTPTATHTYTETGDFSCRLVVVDDDGGTGVASITIRVESPSPPPPPPSLSWSMYGGDSRHTRSGGGVGAPKKVVKWTATMEGYTGLSGPVIGPGGVIHVLSGGGGGTTNLYAFNPDGSEKWTANFQNIFFEMPAVAADGTVYIALQNAGLLAFSSDGTQKWSYSAGGDIGTPPAVGPDGTVYVGSTDDNLYAVNAEGTLRWMYPTGGDVESSPAIGGNGAVYFIDHSGALCALDAGGTLQWQFAASAPIYASPAIGEDGTIYTSGDGVVYAINPDGTMNWAYDHAEWISYAPVLHTDGSIIARDGSQRLICLNPDGSLRWSYNTGWDFLEPVIDASGSLFANTGSQFLALNSDGSVRWWYRVHPLFSLGESNTHGDPAIADDGTVYFCATDTQFDPRLFAFDPNPPATNEPPDGDAELFTDSEGEAPFEVGMGRIYWEDPDGNIISFDWDFDGDNEYDFIDGDKDYLWTYTEPGVYLPKVRLTDNEGASTVLDVGTVTVH